MSVDFESVKDKAVVLAQSGVNKTRELTSTGIAKAKELANAGAAKAKELSEIGKLKMQNSTEQEAIRKAYSDLGKLYYAEHGSDPEAACAELCRSITDALARISYNNERIADIKAAGRASDDETDVAEEPVDADVEAEELVSETPCCCTEEAAAEEPVSETPCCCAGETASEESDCCCGTEKPEAETPVSETPVSETPVSETPCCCGDPAAEDDKTEE